MSQSGRPTMDPKEFDRIRRKLGFSWDGWAIELGYEGTPRGNKNTMRRFMERKREIPLAVAKLAWLLEQSGVPEWPVHLTATPAKECDAVSSAQR